MTETEALAAIERLYDDALDAQTAWLAQHPEDAGVLHATVDVLALGEILSSVGVKP